MRLIGERADARRSCGAREKVLDCSRAFSREIAITDACLLVESIDGGGAVACMRSQDSCAASEIVSAVGPTPPSSCLGRMRGCRSFDTSALVALLTIQCPSCDSRLPEMPPSSALGAVRRFATGRLPSSTCPSCQLRSQSTSYPLRVTANGERRACRGQPPRSRQFSSTARRSEYSLLKSRAVVRLAGKDAAHFLDGLLPAKIIGVDSSPIYTAFLTAQGRILVDCFVYPPTSGKDPEWFIEVDAESSDLLMKHLKKHKLRSKFTLERLQTSPVYDFGRSQSNSADTSSSVNVDGLQDILRAGGPDPRPGMGGRYIITDPDGQTAQLEAALGPQIDPSGDEYMSLRVTRGFAEGQQEISSGASLPQESNIDLLGGIDFHKGCYLGQELTIRTHHTGVVRKRILPVALQHQGGTVEDAPPGSNLSKVSTRKGRSTGKLLRSHGEHGLALCRLEMMTDIQLTADATNFNPDEKYKATWQDAEGNDKSILVAPIVPAWLREGVEASLKRKERRPPRQEVLEEEDEDVD